jgi:GntR family transcriptional regulator / MocR family aminotransferase
MKELFIPLQRNISEPLYFQIYNFIKNEIILGNLTPNMTLPSIKNLSYQLKVNKMTVENAYNQLTMEGYIESKPRSGFFVQKIPIEFFNKKKVGMIKEPISKEVPNIKYDFNLYKIDTQYFPLSTWRKLSNRCLQPENSAIYSPGDPQGEKGLRYEIAKYAKQTRGVQCTDNQIIVGPHSQFFIQLICNIINDNRRSVAISEPGYNLVSKEFEKLGYKIVPITVDKDGMNHEQLDTSQASIVFTGPSTQFPFGTVMSIQKRIMLLEWAAKSNAYIIEDDYLTEFRYDGNTVPTLQGMDRDERVIYMGSFHSNLLPSLRIAYIILPNHLMHHYYCRLSDYQQTTSTMIQNTLEMFLREGHMERHTHRMKQIYHKKYKMIVDAIKTVFKDKIKLLEGFSGLHVVIELCHTLDEVTLFQKAINAGIKVHPMSENWYKSENNTFKGPAFLLGFGGLNMDDIYPGIEYLYKTWYE